MSAKKLTRHSLHFLLLYDFNSFHSPLFGNCANRVPTFLSALPVQAGCSARSANAAHAAKAQSGKDLRPDSRCGPAQAAHQNQYIGQLPAQAKCKCGKPGCAQCFAIARLRDMQRPGQRCQKHQCRKRLPHRRCRGHAVPAGAVLHKAQQHVPVEQQTARHGQIQPAKGLFPLVGAEPAAAHGAEPRGAQAFQNAPHKAAQTGSCAQRDLCTRCGQKTYCTDKSQNTGQRPAATHRFRAGRLCTAHKHCSQHHDTQCQIAPPHRADHAQTGDGIGAKRQGLPRAARPAECSRIKNEQNRRIHQRSSIGLYFWRNAQILVSGTNDTVGEYHLFHAVCTPAGHTGNGEQRGVDILRDAQHVVDQAAEQVHVGAHRLGAALFLGKDARGPAVRCCTAYYTLPQSPLS